ncbi:Sucrose phosphorylase [compost metagenome]
MLTPFTKANGEQVNVWTTFSADQIDINFSNPAILLESIDILVMYSVNGGRSIRLDAIGFIWKVFGSGCIHLPEVHAIIKIWRLILDELVPGTLLITETNVPHAENISYFGQGDEAHMVYQFPLPPLTLHAFLRQNSRMLTGWAKGLSEDATAAQDCGLKTTYFNFLASHDGIGIRPTEGILDDAERSFIATEAERKGGRVNYKTNIDGSTSPYELNINYLSALTEADMCVEEKTKKFVAAQSILLSFVGIPAIYYHSLLGSENDIVGMESSGINRRINREKFQLSEIETALADPTSLRAQVFTEMTRLLKVRREQKAFSPESSQQVLDLGDSLFGLVRGEGTEQITYLLNLSTKAESVVLPYNGVDLVSGMPMSDTIKLASYQFIWLKKV